MPAANPPPPSEETKKEPTTTRLERFLKVLFVLDCLTALILWFVTFYNTFRLVPPLGWKCKEIRCAKKDGKTKLLDQCKKQRNWILKEKGSPLLISLILSLVLTVWPFLKII